MAHTGIPYQENGSAIVALLPDGAVHFLHPAARELINRFNECPDREALPELDDYVLTSPYVALEGFHLSAPAIAFVETTNICNLHCKHCYAWSGAPRPREMSTRQITALIDELADLGVLQLFLTGGELFARRDAVELVQHARSKRFSTQIFSNGLLLTEDILARIPPGQSFFISFDTAVPERTIRGKMDFPKLRRIFELMGRYGHVLRTAISVHRGNVNDIEEIFEWCVEHGYPRPQWLETHPIGRALLNKDILLTPDQVDEVFRVYERCMDHFQCDANPETDASDGADRTATDKPNIRGVQTIKFCQQLERATGQEKCGRSVAYITSQGDVYPCSNCMSNEIYRAGNVTEVSFREIWETGFKAFRRITFDDYDVCNTCDVNRSGAWCQFRCPPLATNISGSETGCGATEYLRRFMIKSNAYWVARKKQNMRLVLVAPRASGGATSEGA